MFDKKTAVRWGVSLAILFVGLGMLYNPYRHPQPLEPVRVYKYTEPPERQEKSVKTGSTSQETTASDSVSEMEQVETLPSVATEMPQNDAEFEVPPELDVDVDEFAELTPEEAAPLDFKTTPSGYPLTPYWDRPMEMQEQLSYEHKLIDHVLVKLYNQGVRDFVAGSIGKNGRVHPPLCQYALRQMERDSLSGWDAGSRH